VGASAPGDHGGLPQLPGTDLLLPFMPHGPPPPPPTGEYTEHPLGFKIGNHPDLTPELRKLLIDGLEARAGTAFAMELSDISKGGGYRGLDGPLRLPVKHDKPIVQPQRRYSKLERDIRDEKCGELRDADLIEPAGPGCPYVSCPTMPVKKDLSGQYTDRRLCIDYRWVNEALVPDRYGLHLAEEVLQQMARNKYHSKLDARQAFMQIPIPEEDRPLTAFWWGNEIWQFKYMPYGLVSGSAKCQRVMDKELAAAGLSGPEGCKAFIDDNCLSSTTDGARGHILLIFKTLDALAEAGLLCHPHKCWFFFPEGTNVLGHGVVPGGIVPHAEKVAAIKALNSPVAVRELKSKLAYLNYYRCYVPNFSVIAAPLNALLRDKAPWVWGPEQEHAYTTLRDIICTPGVVLRPFDITRPTILYTDWSLQGIGAVLHQVGDDGEEYLVSCMSRSLNPHERNASPYEGECLAAVWGVRVHRHLLHGVPFTLVTDHQPLKWLMSNRELTGKHMRWALILQEYTFTVVHRPGAAHTNVDTLSRYPLSSSYDPTGARLELESPGVSPATALAAHPVQFGEGEEPFFLADYTVFNSFAPTIEELMIEPPLWVGEECPLEAAHAAAGLAAVASRWLDAAWERLPRDWCAQHQTLGGPSTADEHGVQQTLCLSTYPVGKELLHVGQRAGIVLYEPFGGLCAGLDMVLTCGLKVSQYYYSDTDPAAQAVARSRVDQFHALYPHLFALEASRGAFDVLPMDVREVDSVHLVTAGAKWQEQWLVVAGWSCEDLSPAGKGAGLAGSRSSNFYDAVRIVGALQQLQPMRPPAFIMENTAMQASFGHTAVREKDFPEVCKILGEPVLLDAAQVGSYAHRLRNYWSNIMPSPLVSLVLAQACRVPGRLVDAVLDSGRRSRPVEKVQSGEFYACNQRGQPPSALPTLVAVQGSRAFRGEMPGMLLVESTGQLAEPNPDERERIMGYSAGCTQAPGVTQAQRHAITGRAMDRHAMVHLMAVMLQLAECQYELVAPRWGTQVWAAPHGGWPYSAQSVRIMEQWGWRPGQPLQSPSARDPILEPISAAANEGTRGLGYTGASDLHGPAGHGKLGGCTAGQATAAAAQLADRLGGCSLLKQDEGAASCCHSSPAAEPYSDLDVHNHYCALLELAEQQDGAEQGVSGSSDPHADAGFMFFLKQGQLPPGVEQKEAARIRRRASRYRVVDGKLQRVMRDGSKRLVPLADQRVDLIRETHQKTGHFGIKRTKHLLMASFWWPGLEADVKKVLDTCEACARIKASFNAERPELQPLPIEGLFYRWGVDMAGPFAESADGNTYVIIMIEHFSKQIELVAVKDKSARTNAYAFLSTVLSRYGGCAEVLTDNGREFDAEFAQLLAESLIDHRRTSPNHPQADGLAERAVQTIKKSLAKHVAQHRQLGDWDWELHWVALGYRCSKQAATGFSPYELLYGVPPIIPPAIKERMTEPVLDFADVDLATEYVLSRAQLLKHNCVIAMSNLRIAQHRDTLRYRLIRGGLYQPITVKFAPGDFVYVRRRTVVNSLQSEARPGIYRIVELLPTGVVVLQGRCGRTMKVNVAECAPCHLTNINPVLDPSLQRVDASFECTVCGSPDDDAVMVLCDGCFRGYHIYCLQPPLAAVPEEEIWLCGDCKSQGMDEQAVSILRQQNMPVAESDAPLFPSVQQRAQDAAAQRLHGEAAWLPGQSDQPWVRGVLEYVPRIDRKERSRSPLRWASVGKEPVYLSFRKAERLVKAGAPDAGGVVASVVAAAAAALAAVFVAESTRTVLPDVLTVVGDEVKMAQAMEQWCGAVGTEQELEDCLAAVTDLAGSDEGGELGFTEGQMWALVWAVDLRVCNKLAVVGGRSAAVTNVMQRRYGRDLWEFCEQPGLGVDQLSASWYKKAQVRKPLDWVFLRPEVRLISLALGLAVQQTRKGVAMLVPRSTLTNMSQLLHLMLQRFASEKRLVFLTSNCSEVAWLVVFAEPHLEQLMVSLRGKVHNTGWMLTGLDL
jgi:transposase InsO family protein